MVEYMQDQELALLKLMKACIRTLVINWEERRPIIALFGTQLADLLKFSIIMIMQKTIYL